MAEKVQRLWTASESRKVRNLWPDVPRLIRLLGRSDASIRGHARWLGLTKKGTGRIWTDAELDILTRLWKAKASNAELFAALPGRTFKQIRAAAYCYGLGPRFRVLKPVDPLKAAILSAARERRISKAQLDRLARSGCYFSESCSHHALHHLIVAAQVLNVPLHVEWEPLD